MHKVAGHIDITNSLSHYKTGPNNNKCMNIVRNPAKSAKVSRPIPVEDFAPSTITSKKHT